MSTEENVRRSSVGEDEDWRGITDAAERRRAQNRIAQRNYRRNIKLRQQQLDQINEALVSCAKDPTQRQAFQLLSTPLNASSSKTSSESSHESGPTMIEGSTTFGTCWPDVVETPTYLSELAINTEDLEALSLVPSAQETGSVFQEGDEIDYMTQWMHQEKDFGLLVHATDVSLLQNASATRPATTFDTTPLNALQKAVLRGQTSVVKLLAENGANVYVVDEQGNNILHLAVRSGSSPLVLFALKNGINVNDTNIMGHTPLHIAVEREDLAIIKILLGAGADVEIKS